MTEEETKRFFQKIITDQPEPMPAHVMDRPPRDRLGIGKAVAELIERRAQKRAEQPRPTLH